MISLTHFFPLKVARVVRRLLSGLAGLGGVTFGEAGASSPQTSTDFVMTSEKTPSACSGDERESNREN
jgi:hypothetical protein